MTALHEREAMSRDFSPAADQRANCLLRDGIVRDKLSARFIGRSAARCEQQQQQIIIHSTDRAPASLIEFPEPIGFRGEVTNIRGMFRGESERYERDSRDGKLRVMRACVRE